MTFAFCGYIYNINVLEEPCTSSTSFESVSVAPMPLSTSAKTNNPPSNTFRQVCRSLSNFVVFTGIVRKATCSVKIPGKNKSTILHNLPSMHKLLFPH